MTVINRGRQGNGRRCPRSLRSDLTGGFGRSSRPADGYDFDTLAADLDKFLTELDLRDVTLVGFSLGTGELARYIGAHGTERLKACVFIESLGPFLRQIR